MSEHTVRRVETEASSVAFTPSHDVAAPSSCLNCGAAVASNYCSECGQRIARPDPTLRELAEELAGELLHWDGKLWTTLVTLVRRPGALTAEYLAGKRVSFISPLKLYLSASVLYFFLAALGPSIPDSKPMVRFGDEEQQRSTRNATVAREVVAPVAVSAVDTSAAGAKGIVARLGVRMSRGAERAAKDQANFTTRLRDRIGTVVFLILPAFAYAVGLVYRRQRRHFPQHLVFALHVHAVVFLGLALSELGRFTGNASAASAIETCVGLALAVYVVAALRRVYGGSIPRTLAKAAVLGAVYLVFFSVGIGGLVAFTFLEF